MSRCSASMEANLNAFVFWTGGYKYEKGTLMGNCHYLTRFKHNNALHNTV
ncbi:hypothetical protein LSH36_40g07000 [Paralvinella palmiformis]|uniref:Uncharacterized protein n=1 Tax=Paralvinella palmiformis TaxID=53620 RepID=A0AAD9K7I2_9ANNE|nr:hypothetical protein LSH36_40g07000 [Paralvinella palmiformis]